MTMNRDLYSNTEFTELKKRINAEIIRRGGFRWFDPLSTPKIGIDRSSPLSLPETDDERVLVTDKTYTINNPSTDSIVETRNIPWPANGENPAGENPTYDGNEPSTSAAALTVDEIQNFLVGLTKIKDINLFYGRGEVEGVAFRDPQGIEDVLVEAEADELSEIYTDEGVPYTRQDFNGGMKEYENPRYPIDNPLIQEFPKENGIYVLPSGEMDGEETLSYKGPGVDNFFDDYGAEPGDGNYHPFNRGITPRTRRDYWIQDKHRKETRVVVEQGGIHSEVYGANPRNPNQGQPYKSIPAYRGKPSTCQSACTGLCSMTCDSQCSESCSVTCTIRCGNACTNQCENVCTGCSSLCYSSCQTKCENSTGYACVKSGAVAVRIYTTGGTDGTPAVNHLDVETYTCQGCSYSCQFYPNKKTECWDAGCMGKCFTSCTTACSTSCLGGCTNNDATGTKGQGCQAACTINCSGNCQGTCEGVCVATCYHQCKQTCSDNCSFSCDTICGEGCDNGCTNGCTGCAGTCESYCTGQNDMYGCTGCGTKGGCTSACQFDCNQNCISRGCRSLCGIDNAGACSNNCRISCTSSSCTSQCSNQCTDQCTTCVNGCGWQCGACGKACSTGCESACGLTCTATCEHSCESNCVQSCTEACGACSSLCFSCVSMCIGVCSLTCNGKCSSCANQCSWWCDSKCNQQCFANCVDMCMQSCSNSCSTYVGIHADTPGPERDPTSPEYPNPHPGNRPEERESFKVIPGIITDDCIDVYADENEHLILAYYGTERFEPELHPSGRHMILYSRGAPYDIRTSHVHFHDVNGRLIVIITGEK